MRTEIFISKGRCRVAAPAEATGYYGFDSSAVIFVDGDGNTVACFLARGSWERIFPVPCTEQEALKSLRKERKEDMRLFTL